MAISARAAGTWAAAEGTTQTVTLPTHAAGDMLILRAACKANAGEAPSAATITCSTSGWTAVADQYNNGTTVNGNGVGSVAHRSFYKIATSDAETSPVVTWGTTAYPGGAVAISYQKGSTEFWLTPTGAGGGDATLRTSQTCTISSHISVTSGDMVDFWLAWGDNYASTNPTITQTGVTFDTVTEYPATALSSSAAYDMAADGGYRLATSGTSSAAAVVTATFGNSEQGGAWQTRLRVSTSTQQVGQAQAHIKTTHDGYAQALGLIKQTIQVFAQAEVQITLPTTTNNAYAQAQADIKTTYQVCAQALSDIKQIYSGYAQAMSDIMQTYSGYAQSQADIKQTYLGYAQTNAWITQTALGSAQAQASILAVSLAYAQANAKIFGVSRYEQSAQALAQIKQTYQAFAQAQGQIKSTVLAYGQALGTIKSVYEASGQTMAQIVATYRGYAQAAAYAKTTGAAYGQALAYMKGIAWATGQARAYIESAVVVKELGRMRAKDRAKLIMTVRERIYTVTISDKEV